MNIVVIVIVAAAGVVALRLLSHKQADNGESADGVPDGKRETFETGLHPCSDGQPVMYTLSTCRHCVHLKNFLTAHGIEHHLVFVDDFSGQARSDMMHKVRSYNPRGSFPTLVLPGEKVIVGFREHEVRAALGLPDQD